MSWDSATDNPPPRTMEIWVPKVHRAPSVVPFTFPRPAPAPDPKMFLPVPAFMQRENITSEIWETLRNLPVRKKKPHISDRTYLNMLPAFQLANVMMRIHEGFFARIVNAPVFKGEQYNTLSENWSSNSGLDKSLDDIFEEFKHRVQIVSTNDKKAFGTALPVLDEDGKLTLVLELHKEFFDFFSSPDYDNIPQEVRDMVTVQLAATLAHECANHAWTVRCYFMWGQLDMFFFWSSTSQGEDLGSRFARTSYARTDVNFRIKVPEPKIGLADVYFKEKGELGHALEKEVFGGSLDLCPMSKTALYRDAEHLEVDRHSGRADSFLLEQDEVAALTVPANWARMYVMSDEDVAYLRMTHEYLDGYTDFMARLHSAAGLLTQRALRFDGETRRKAKHLVYGSADDLTDNYSDGSVNTQEAEEELVALLND